MVLTSGMMSSHAQIGTLNANNAVPNNVGQTDNADNKAVLNDLIEQVDGKIKDNQQVTVIVEVNDENMSKEHGITVPDITKVRTKDGLEDQIDYAKKSQDLLMSEMDEAGVSYQVVEVYDTVLNGVAIKTTLEDAKKIAELNEVKSMELSRTIAAPKLESNTHKTLDETSNEMVEANKIWSNYSGKGQLIAILDSGVDPEHEIFKKVDEGSLRIKSEGDYIEAKNLVERYGVILDPVLHEEILQRYAKLNISPYKGFINPWMKPVYGHKGEIIDIELGYTETFEHQMLRYSKEYGLL